MRVLIRLLNKGVHAGIGFWSGWAINDERYNHGAWAFLVSFLFYQGLESLRKGDKGWPETREFMIGMGAALMTRRFLGDGYSDA